MRRLKKGVYVETNFRGGTVAAIDSAEGTMLVNSPRIPSDARQWRQEVEKSVKSPLIYLFYTDHTPDHILGAQYFEVPIIAHHETRHEMRRYGDTFKNRLIDSYRSSEPLVAAGLENLEIIMAEVAFSKTLDIYKGDRVFHFIHIGGASKAASALYLPDDKILFAGNVVVNGIHPAMGEGRTDKWLEALDLIESMDIDYIVPGYGRVCKMEAIHTMRDYINEIRRQVWELRAAGKSRDEVVKKVDMMSFFPVPPGKKDVIVKRLRQSARRVHDEFAGRI